jgi:hypothetical protein
MSRRSSSAAVTLPAESADRPRVIEGGPPTGGHGINPKFARLLCKLYRRWEAEHPEEAKDECSPASE